MPETAIKIPQIGEGLQEARVVALLKNPGDTIKRDEAIYQMETDKAVMDVESPISGKVVRWLAAPDDVLAIGADILIVDTDEAVSAQEAAPVAAIAGNKVQLLVPQIGEGLQEARIVAFLKNPGDAIKRDDAVYQMETDKAVMDVESPYEGTLIQWVAKVDEVLPIGAPVGVISSTTAVAASAAAPTAVAPKAEATAAASSTGDRRRDVPPRTRAYAKSKGLTDDQLDQIGASGSKLMPEDIDAFLSAGQSQSKQVSGRKFLEYPMSPKQRVLSSRLVRGNQLVVPGMMSVAVNWEPLEQLRHKVKQDGGEFQPSAFTYFSFAVAQAARAHSVARSTLVSDGTVRTYENLYLGIAVAMPGDELVVAVVDNADSLTWRQFAQAARERISKARDGQDQAHEAVTLSITNMSGHGIRDAMAVVVPPGVITVFLGEVHWGIASVDHEPKFQRQTNVGVTIDHRLINGVGGADFLNAIKANVEHIVELTSG